MNTKEVKFNEYCDKCVNKNTDEYEMPCDECLEYGYNEDSHKPIHFKEVENSK